MRCLRIPPCGALLLLVLSGAAWAQTAEEPRDEAPEEDAAAPAAGEQRRFVSRGPGGEALEIAAGPGSILGKDELILKGYVDIRYRDIRLQADFIRYVTSTQDTFAEGNVILDQGSARIIAETLTYNLGTDTGTFSVARGFAEPNIQFEADRIDKISADELVLYEARVTACTQPIPYWSFKIGRGLLHLGEYAYLHDLSFRIGRAPIFYTPYLVWPIKTDRASGLLFPEFGFSDRGGTVFSEAFYLALGRSQDATIYFDYWSKAGYGTGLEYRYVPNETGAGKFTGYFIKDQVAKDEDREGVPVDRWVINYTHRQEFASEWRLVANANFISDFDYYLDFARDIRLSSNPQAVSDVLLTRNWGFYSLNARAQRREQLVQVEVEPVGIGDPFSSREEQTIDRWIRPEVEMRGSRSRLGNSPLFLTLESSVDSFNKGDVDVNYQRFDVFPTISSQLSPVPWLDIDASAGYRDTYYSKSQFDDLGCDNLPNTGDFGEGNGRIDGEIDTAVCNTAAVCTAGTCVGGEVPMTACTTDADCYACSAPDSSKGIPCTQNSDCGTVGTFEAGDDLGCDNLAGTGDYGEGNGVKDQEGTVVLDDSFNRGFYQAGVTIIGPKVSRVYDRPASSFSPKYKHTIEPTLRYTFQSEVKNVDQVIRFDEIDRLAGDVNSLTYGIVTRLFAKRPTGSAEGTGFPGARSQLGFIGGSSDPVGGSWESRAPASDVAPQVGQAPSSAGAIGAGESASGGPELSTVEVATLEISQTYSFLGPISSSGALGKTRNVSPIRGTLRVNPSVHTSLDLRTSFDVLFNEIRDASLSANLRSDRRGFLGVTWSLIRDLEGAELFAQGRGIEPFDRSQIGLNGETNLLGRRLLLGMQINYELGDIAVGEPRLRDQRYKLGYNTQCCGFQIEYLNRNFVGSSSRELRFLVNLRGVGNVVDLHTHASSGGF